VLNLVHFVSWGQGLIGVEIVLMNWADYWARASELVPDKMMKMDPLVEKGIKSPGTMRRTELAQQCTLGLVNSRSDLCRRSFRHVDSVLWFSFSLFSDREITRG